MMPARFEGRAAAQAQMFDADPLRQQVHGGTHRACGGGMDLQSGRLGHGHPAGVYGAGSMLGTAREGVKRPASTLPAAMFATSRRPSLQRRLALINADSSPAPSSSHIHDHHGIVRLRVEFAEGFEDLSVGRDERLLAIGFVRLEVAVGVRPRDTHRRGDPCGRPYRRTWAVG